MKKTALTMLFVVILLVASFGVAYADKPTQVDSNGVETAWEKSGCTTIQSGLLTSSTGQTLTTGYDQWGYNYQAHMFNGYYGNFSRPSIPVTEGDILMMKWNDAWLANVDCGGNGLNTSLDGKLDRYQGFASYKGSGAWLTNHMMGTYEDGTTWEYFVKIVAVPTDADSIAGVWYTADGVEIGPAIWGDFAVIQEVSNDAYVGDSGLMYNGDTPNGFGFYQP